MDLSVMFFGAESNKPAAEKYAEVMEIATVADQLAYQAVWLPERHFQQFGQAFPNPTVLAAALAVRTTRVDIRAGSIVLPLHHPVRVVEDWSIIDNLSGGRIGLSLATGWHTTDFVLAPTGFARRREHTLESIDVLRRLWRGDEVLYSDPHDQPVAVRTEPRPFRADLPLWLTSSGNPLTWQAAAHHRVGVLAATIGQTREELAEKIKLYRAIHPTGTVTVMVHAFVGPDEDTVRRMVRRPLMAYLKSFVRQISSSKDGARERAVREMKPEDVDRLTEFAFERYLSWGAVIGSADRCGAVLADLRDVGCDEIACFVDFGLDATDVVKSLYALEELRQSVC